MRDPAWTEYVILVSLIWRVSGSSDTPPFSIEAPGYCSSNVSPELMSDAATIHAAGKTI